MLNNSKEQITRRNKRQTAHNMLRALLGLIAMQAIAHNDEDSKDIRRNSEELSLVALEAERCDDGGSKVSEGVEGVGHEEVGDGEEPEEGVGDGVFGNFAVPVLVVHGGGVGAETLDGEGAFFGGEP